MDKKSFEVNLEDLISEILGVYTHYSLEICVTYDKVIVVSIYNITLKTYDRFIMRWNNDNMELTM